MSPDEAEIKDSPEGRGERACRAAGLPSPVTCMTVTMPPTWRGPESVPYTYVFTERQPTAAAVRRFYAEAVRGTLPNPRLFWPDSFALASLHHPLFFAAVSRSNRLDPQRWGGARSTRAAGSVATVRFWLQSTLFLAGVTLSAAVVQSRWSAGTVGSKLDRLWQAALCAPRAGLDRIDALRLADFVREQAVRPPGVAQLIDLKQVFGRALAAVTEPENDHRGATLTAEPLDLAGRERFGFVGDLRRRLGDNLRAVIAYGSSVTSSTFADYDLMVVVEDARSALTSLAGSHPDYRGVELNLSVFDETDFHTFQLVSGDNLTENARCLWGEITVPVKPVDLLLVRNYSFGFVRMRQLLGMAAHALRRPLGEGRDEKQSLYGYFAKIPLNVMKGIGASVGEPVTKEYIAAWMRDELDYNVDLQLRACAAGGAGGAIADAAWATAEVLRRTNMSHRVYERVSAEKAQIWRELESESDRSGSTAGSTREAAG